MKSPSQNPPQSSLNERELHQARENAYNKQKDLHKHIETDISELLDKDGVQQEGEKNNIDSSIEKATHSNVSANILQEYQLGQFSRTQTRSRASSGGRSNNQLSSQLSKNNTPEPTKVDRRVNDLYKWKDRISKKQELQREFQEHIKDSMYGYKVYTNDRSNEMLETVRPHIKVENLLLLKGRAKEIKIKKLEQELYGVERVPKITTKAQKLVHQQNVHTRLYELDKQRREKSREKSRETLSRRNSQSNESSNPRSKSEVKRRVAYSSTISPSHHHQIPSPEFFFSPREAESPILPPKTSNIPSRSNLSPEPPTTFSPMSPELGPVQDNRIIKGQKQLLILGATNRIREPPRSALHSTPINQTGEESHPITPPTNIYKRLTPVPHSIDTFTAATRQYSSQVVTTAPSLVQSPSRFDNINKQQQYNSQQQSKKATLNTNESETTSAPVLPNMLFFKNAEKHSSSTAMNVNSKPINNDLQRDKILAAWETNAKGQFDIRSMEVFWDKILQDDVEERAKRDQKGRSNFEGYEYSQLSLAERSRLWAQKRDAKLNGQRKVKEEKELQGCTFKPQLYSRDQQTRSNNQIQSTLPEKTGQKSTNPSLETINYPFNGQLYKNGYLTMNTGIDQDFFGNLDESPKELRNTKHPNDLQKKLYNYILNSPN